MKIDTGQMELIKIEVVQAQAQAQTQPQEALESSQDAPEAPVVDEQP